LDPTKKTASMPLLTYGEEYKMEFESSVASLKETPGKIRDSTWLMTRKIITGAIIKAIDKGFVQTATRGESHIIFEASLPRTWPRYKERLKMNFLRSCPKKIFILSKVPINCEKIGKNILISHDIGPTAGYV